MNYDVYYKKERNGKFTIIVNDEKIKTPLISERVTDSLCEDINSFLDDFNEDDYFFQIQLSDESEPLGIIVDIWQDDEIENENEISEEEPYDSATFLFDDYSSDYYDDEDEDEYFNQDDSDYDKYDE